MSTDIIKKPVMSKICNFPFSTIKVSRGGSGIFSRRGGGAFCQKKFKNFVDFFEVDHIDFPSSPRKTNFEKTGQKRCFSHFLKNVDVFSARALPPQNKHILAPNAPLESF